MQTSSTRLLADYIVASRGHELPPHVIEKAKLWMLDAIGCGLGGSRTVSAHTAVDALTQWSRGPCRVIGRGVSTDPGTSAYLNAQAINALDFDDCDPSGHPSSTLIGALLSLSAICNATGLELLNAYVVLALKPLRNQFSSTLSAWVLRGIRNIGCQIAALEVDFKLNFGPETGRSGQISRFGDDSTHLAPGACGQS